MKNKRLVVVLGMHRSGSSAITKGLEVLGVDLGSHLMAADANNAKGYFEDIELNQLNKAILSANGLDWCSLSHVSNDDFRAEKFIPLKEAAIQLLERKTRNTDVLGIKDPRLCRLLPFWQDVFDALQLNTSYVIILRDLESIASSLLSRDAFPRVKSLYLWLEHMIPAFRETGGHRRCVVSYDELIAQPESVIETLADKLDLRAQLDQKALHEYATDFIDAGLKHHRGKPGPGTRFTPEPVRRLATLLDHVSRQSVSIDSPAFSQEIDSIDQACRDRADILAYIDTLDSIIIDRGRKLNEQGKRLDTMTAARDEASEAAESGRETIARRDSQIEGLKTEITESDRQLSALRDLLRERETEIESLKRSLSDFHTQIEASGRRIETLEQRCESTASDAEKLALQLEEIHSGFIWRSSIMARKSLDFIKYVFRLRKEPCQAIPLHDLERAGALDHSWIAKGSDPSFRLRPLSGVMPTGWVRINTCIVAGPAQHSFKIYFDCGEGFSEATALKLPISAAGMVDEVVHLPGNLESMRLDPMECAGEFKLAPIKISEINWLFRKLYMMKKRLGAATG